MKKVIKTSFYLLSFLLVVFSCCKKQHPLPNLLKGKIKHIKLNYSNIDNEFLFLYDSIDGSLQKVISDTIIHAVISTKINGFVIIDYNSLPTDINPNQKIRLKAYIEDDNYISRIVQIDTNTLNESNIITFYNTNGKPDSILENPFVIISNFKLYDFAFVNNNVTKSVRSYNNLISGNHIDSLFFYFTNKEQPISPIPSQKIYSHNRIQGYGGTIATDPVYLLEINGYKCYNSNKNLIDSIYTVNSSGINAISKYRYVFSNDNQFSEMKIIDNLTYNYSFDYY